MYEINKHEIDVVCGAGGECNCMCHKVWGQPPVLIGIYPTTRECALFCKENGWGFESCD